MLQKDAKVQQENKKRIEGNREGKPQWPPAATPNRWPTLQVRPREWGMATASGGGNSTLTMASWRPFSPSFFCSVRALFWREFEKSWREILRASLRVLD